MWNDNGLCSYEFLDDKISWNDNGLCSYELLDDKNILCLRLYDDEIFVLMIVILQYASIIFMIRTSIHNIYFSCKNL